MMSEVSPSTIVMFAMSKLRTWYMRSVTLNRPWIAFSCAWRQRLGLTVAGASPFRNSNGFMLKTGRGPLPAMVASGSVPTKP